MTNSLFAVIILLSKNDLKNNFKIFYLEVSFLMTSSKLRIGLAIDYVYSDYSIALLEGIKKACKDFNAELLIFPIGELNNISFAYDYQYTATAALISSKNLDGLVFASGTQLHYMSKGDLHSYIKGFNPIPVVSLSAAFPGITSITVECYSAYKNLIDNLIDVQKCKKFGIVSVRGSASEPKIRTKYIKEILKEKEVPSKNITIWKSNFSYTSVFEDLSSWYEVNKKFDFDALICLSDEMAYGAIDFCKKIGKRIPEDIVVSGFDDLDRSKYLLPPLTSINQRLFDQGYKSVSLLTDLIKGKKVPYINVVDAKIRFRKSTSKISRLKVEKIDEQSHYSAIEWYSKREQFYSITKFYTEMQNDISLEQLRARINDDIRLMGITACAIVLYEQPIEMAMPFEYFNLPHKARLFAAYDDYCGYDSNKSDGEIRFDPNETYLPKNTIQANDEGVLVVSLYHKTLQYGYIVLRQGQLDVAVYDLFTKITSTIISNIYSFALMHNETTEYRAKFDKMDVIARTDELTGLNNRRGLYDLGQTTLKFAKAMGQSGMVVYCDMDGLKKMNDTYGHEAGDRAIMAESIILKGNFRSNDIVSRIGGDEFALICPGLTPEAFTRIKAQVNIDCEKWSIDNHTPFSLSISMGAVVYPGESDGYQLTALLSKADDLLYKEKRAKKNLDSAKKKKK